jgi:hypothetical protein
MSIVASVPAVDPVCWSPGPDPELESKAGSAGFLVGLSPPDRSPPPGAASPSRLTAGRQFRPPSGSAGRILRKIND